MEEEGTMRFNWPFTGPSCYSGKGDEGGRIDDRELC